MAKRLLMLCLDGVRSDCIMHGNCKNIKQLMRDKNSEYTLYCKTIKRTISTPSWYSILCGIENENVKTNKDILKSDSIRFLINNIFLNRIREYSRVLISSWQEFYFAINDATTKSIVEFYNDKDVYGNDSDVIKRTCELIEEKDDKVIVSYFMNVDKTGHDYGFNFQSEKYVKALEVFDEGLGEIMDSIKESNDDWMIILTSNHGGSYYKDLDENQKLELEETECNKSEGINGLDYSVYRNTLYVNNCSKNKNKELIGMRSIDIINKINSFFSNYYN